MKKIVASVFALVAMVAAGCGPDLGTPTPSPEVANLQGLVGTACTPGTAPDGQMGRCYTPRGCAIGQLWCRGQTPSGGWTFVCADPPEGVVCQLDAGTPAVDAGTTPDASVPADAVAPATDTGSVPAVDAGPFVDAGAACQAGVGVCRRSGVWRTNMYGNRFCDAVPAAPTAEICNGLDDNCDGTVDNGITCVCLIGATRVCYAGPTATRGVGICRDGQQRCVGTAPTSWGSCDGQVLPRPEVPNNGLDDNCDGVADNP